MATWPGDATQADRGCLRASHADRERVIGTLKTAFVQGRLAKDEFDERVSQTLAARTYAELGALTADIPAGLAAPSPPAMPAQGLDRLRASTAAKMAAGVALLAGLLMIAAISNDSNPVTGLMAVALLSPLWLTALGGLLVLHERLDRRAARSLPPDGRRLPWSGVPPS